MKITLINHSDTLGGASTVTFRLMEALREAGADARMLVTHKASGSHYVTKAAPAWRSKIPFLAEHLRIWRAKGFSSENLFKISIATDGLPLSRHPLVLDADAVILNWVNQGMLSLDEISRIAARVPLIWTMHDMWNITGICHHAGSCDKYTSHCHDCPLMGNKAAADDLSAMTFDRKHDLYTGSRIHFVAVSRWLADLAARSALTADQPVTVINNPFRVDMLSVPVNKERGELGLPWHGRIVLMCAARLDDPFKNLPDAIEALNTLTDTDAVAVFVGECRDTSIFDSLAIPHFHLGMVNDKRRLHGIFASSSVVMSSSTYESFGATLLEGQAAGATPVGYVHDGRADIITDGVTGYAAGPGIRSLGEALRTALDSPISHSKLYQAAARYSYANIAGQYLGLINSL